MHSVALIMNPAAGRGRLRTKLAAVVEIFRARGIASVFETTGRGDEEALTHQAISGGSKTIVAVGGDGTCGRIADAIMRSGSSCRLAVIPAGTGNDFAKTLGVEGYTAVQIADLVVGGQETRIDIGLAAGHYFLNSCGFGFDASVLEASQKIRLLKGDAVYIYSALRQLFSYRGIHVSQSGAGAVQPGRMLMITVSNGRYLGGAFKIAPYASVVDGKLDVCFFSDSSVVERARLFLGALRGTHLGMRAVSSASVQELALTFAEPPSMEIDGELRTADSTTVELKCVPRALSVVAAPGALA